MAKHRKLLERRRGIALLLPRMSSPPQLPFLGKNELFDRLGEGACARLAVLTPNRRLANALLGEFDDAQAARGLSRWETPDVLPYGGFLERLHEDALYSSAVSRLPLLLTPVQEQFLWEDIIATSEWGDELLAPAKTAEEARKAWMLAQQWRMAGMLGRFPGNEDATAFAAWSAQYRRRTGEQRQIDAARLPDLMATLLQERQVRTPQTLVLYAFDILTPQLSQFVSACAQAGIEVYASRPERQAAQLTRWPLASAREELEWAALWARARLEEAAGNPVRIGIVVPDLEQRRREVLNILSRQLRPGYNLPGTAVSGAPFNLSLGEPLAHYPLPHAALGLIALAQGSVDFALASRLLRSPFLGGGRSEVMARARLDAALRHGAPVRLTLRKLMAIVTATGQAPPLLSAHLGALFEAAQWQGGARRPLHEWAGHFSVLLKAAGFPGERTLDSAEYQTLAKWNQVLAELAALSRVAPALNAQQALNRLTWLCRDSLFQPESGAVPIQVLGVLESAGLAFEHLWVCGLSDEAWPLPARPNPFIPPALQQKAGVPEASAVTALDLDRRITEDWLGAAGEVVISHPLREQDRELSPSTLIAGIPEGALALPANAHHRDVLYAMRALEALPESTAPLAATRLRGGSSVLADQSACPFRAFAVHRLGAAPLEAPAEGLNAAARGTLVHALMKGIWDELLNQAALQSKALPELDALISRAAAAAITRIRRDVFIEDTLAALEQERLERLAHEWLEVERARSAFECVASEEKRPLTAAGLALSGRLDRMDRLADGTHVLIDYKTGRATPKWWEGARPEDPQLPLYAVNAAERISAVAFAKLKRGGMRFMGYSQDKNVLPRVKQYRNWDGLLAGWKEEVHRLGEAFVSGVAEVEPKHPGQTCRHCALQPLCRVHERFSALALADNEAFDEHDKESE